MGCPACPRPRKLEYRQETVYQQSTGKAGLASLEQVRGLAGRLAGLERIDVLINNAGLVLGERRITPDGLEHVFALNHLVPFLLTNLLLPKLTASAPARVITVTSARTPPPVSTSATRTWSTGGTAGGPTPTASWPTSCSRASLPAGWTAPG
jgi:NAD(P)-dependent dehydrogenase (short-subunit alcohol dehydrogenase family)